MKNELDMNQIKIPTAVIVGRPNVGKSALFNAIIGKRISIVHEESGVTRDNIIYPCNWQNKYFLLIDTGGLGEGTLSPSKIGFFDAKICSQVETAINSADVLIMVVDITAGVTPLDMELAKTLRESGKKIFLCVNKADNDKIESTAGDFFKLGFDNLFPVSCLHKRGINNLIENFTNSLWEIHPPEEEEKIYITVSGRPNVGKSSIINKLMGKDRLIVSNIAGTTRDAVNVDINIVTEDKKLPAVLIDTAGLRKKGRADTAVEIFSIMRAKEAIEKSDIVIFVIEATQEGSTAQDAKIGQIISDAGKGCIIVANKWDACSGLKQKDIEKEIRYKMPFLAYAPIVFTCALSGYNFSKLQSEIIDVYEQFKVKVPTSTVNKILGDAISKTHPPCINGKFFKVYYGTMVANKPPLFKLFVNNPKLCHPSYMSYLKNYIRKSFNFKGLPIHIKLVKRESAAAKNKI